MEDEQLKILFTRYPEGKLEYVSMLDLFKFSYGEKLKESISGPTIYYILLEVARRDVSPLAKAEFDN